MAKAKPAKKSAVVKFPKKRKIPKLPAHCKVVRSSASEVVAVCNTDSQLKGATAALRKRAAAKKAPKKAAPKKAMKINSPKVKSRKSAVRVSMSDSHIRHPSNAHAVGSMNVGSFGTRSASGKVRRRRR